MLRHKSIIYYPLTKLIVIYLLLITKRNLEYRLLNYNHQDHLDHLFVQGIMVNRLIDMPLDCRLI